MYINTRICTITFALVSFTSYIPALSQPTATTSNILSKLRVDSFQQPQLPDNGTPTGRRKGAAGRGNCALEPPLTALVPVMEKTLPENQKETTYVWGKTITEHPTFWFYVPYSDASLRSAEFVLQDGEDNIVYQTPLTLPTTPGIVGFRLPSTVTPLKIGKMYRWFFKLNIDCAPQQSSIVKDYVEGWVQRVEDPSLTSKPKAATPQQRIALYAQNGIWYEVLTTLIELRILDADNATLNGYWTSMLKSVGLSNVASMPIVNCCIAKQSRPLQGIGIVNK